MGSLSCKVVQGGKDVGDINVNVPVGRGPGVYVPFILEVIEGIQPQEDLWPGPQV
jgi:hypothetical protein